MPVSARGEKDEGRVEEGERERGRAETSIAARLQIHGKPPHEGSLAASQYPC